MLKYALHSRILQTPSLFKHVQFFPNNPVYA